MKTIYFIRHAKSSWSDLSLKDIDRPLNERGKNDINIIGQTLLNKNICPHIIISSPSKRTLLTSIGIMNYLGIDEQIRVVENKMYHAMYYEVMDIVRMLDDDHQIVMLFGHNPSITNFANKFSANYIENIPTLGVIKIQCNISKWSELTQRNSELVDFFYPKQFK